MADNPYETYRRTQIGTASQGRLILMLYDGAIKNLHIAQNSIAGTKVNEAHNALVKAQDIILELDVTLNMDAGEIANNLRALYQYMRKRLVEANVNKDAKTIEHVLELLATLKEGWAGIILKDGSVSKP